MGWKDYLPEFKEALVSRDKKTAKKVIVIHETCGDKDDGSDAARYNQTRKDGIHQHWTVGYDGTAWLAFHFAWMGSCQKGINDIGVGIEHDLPCTKADVPSEEQLVTSAQIVAAFCHFIGKEPSRDFIIGHVEDNTTKRQGEEGDDWTAWGGTSTHTNPVGGWPWKHYMKLVWSFYKGDDDMTDLEKKQLATALELAREATKFIEGMKLRIKGEPIPENPSPIRAGWKTANVLMKEPSA